MSAFDLADLRLFVNVADTLSLTRGAERSRDTVLRHALLILKQADLLASDLRKNVGQTKGTIRLYANTLSISEFIPAALQKFLLDYRGVNIDLHERPSAEISKALKQGAADVGHPARTGHGEGSQTSGCGGSAPEYHPQDVVLWI